MAKRIVRPETDPPVLLALRGGLLNVRSDLRTDALRNYRMYGFYGISVFGIDAEYTRDFVLATKLNRWEAVTVLSRDDVAASGLHLIPTGKAPHYDVCFEDRENLAHNGPESLTELADRLCAVPCEIVHNGFNTLGEDQ